LKAVQFHRGRIEAKRRKQRENTLAAKLRREQRSSKERKIKEKIKKEKKKNVGFLGKLGQKVTHRPKRRAGRGGWV
jgi:hypothetical protein